jgi:hypothetical protein
LQARKEPHEKKKQNPTNKPNKKKKNLPFSHAKIVIIATYTSKARRNTITTKRGK